MSEILSVYGTYAELSRQQVIMQELKAEEEKMLLNIEAAKKKMQEAKVLADKMAQQRLLPRDVEQSLLGISEPFAKERTLTPAVDSQQALKQSPQQACSFCRSCGSKTSSAAVFCANCGAKKG